MTKDRPLTFNSNNICLADDDTRYVMMEWERPLMKRHAEIVCRNGGNILEIGFGMGISADYIQSFDIRSHTIVEVNPQILVNLYKWGEGKENVNIIEGDWSDTEVYNKIISRQYDGIFYDADCKNLYHVGTRLVDKCIKNGGVFTYFDTNGRDLHGYGKRMNRDYIVIDEVPKNRYFSGGKCYYNWINYPYDQE